MQIVSVLLLITIQCYFGRRYMHSQLYSFCSFSRLNMNTCSSGNCFSSVTFSGQYCVDTDDAIIVIIM